MVNFRPQLRQIILNISTRCNYRCRICDVWDLSLPEMPVERIKELLEQARELGAQGVNIGQGEPLLRPDLLEIIDFAGKLNFAVTIVTNGNLVTEEFAQRLTPYAHCLNIVVSLDGAKKNHDWIRGEGTFAKAIRAIKILKKYNLFVATNSVISKCNWSSLRELVDLADELNLSSISINPFCRENLWRRKEELFNFEITDEEEIKQLAQLIEETIAYAQDRKVRLRSEDALRAMPGYFRLGQRIYPQGGCSVPFSTIIVDSRNQAIPCFFMWDEAEDISRKSLAQIWRGDKFRRAREKALNNRCPGCLNGCANDFAAYGLKPKCNGAKKNRFTEYLQKKYALYRAIGPRAFLRRVNRKLRQVF